MLKSLVSITQWLSAVENLEHSESVNKSDESNTSGEDESEYNAHLTTIATNIEEKNDEDI
jgi:hypothetical protein